MNLSRWFRWFPLAVGKKNAMTGAELRAAIGTRATPPKRTQPADQKKLRHSRLKAELERKRSA